jgi:hypothetical protein
MPGVDLVMPVVLELVIDSFFFDDDVRAARMRFWPPCKKPIERIEVAAPARTVSREVPAVGCRPSLSAAA